MTTLEHKKYGSMGSEFIVHHRALQPKRLLVSLIITSAVAAVFQLNETDVAVLWAMCLCLAVLLLCRLLYKVRKETLLVVPGVGVQVKTQYYLGGLDTHFFDKSCVRGIVINEAITMHSVLCYLAVLTTTGAGHDHTLFPLFTRSWPGLKDLVYIYQAVEKMQVHQSQEPPPPPPSPHRQKRGKGRVTAEATLITQTDNSDFQKSEVNTRNRRQPQSSKS